jgi:acetyltransferase
VGLKVQSSDIAHKTEAGALVLGLQGEAAVREAHARVLANARAYRADARIEGVLVQEMVPEGLDVLVGVSRDLTFGPVVTVGLGGIYVEVMKDVAFGLPPFGTDHVHAMLRGLRSYPLLEGVRGQPPLDVDALVDCIVRVGWFALDCTGRFDELDLNPVRVLPRGRGVRVIDALVVTGPPQEPSDATASAQVKESL